MQRSTWWRDYGPAVLAATLALAVFAVDLRVSSEVPVGPLYALVVVLALLAPPHAVAPVTIAAAATIVLSVATVILAPRPLDVHTFWGQVCTVAAVALTAALVGRHRRTNRTLRASVRRAEEFREQVEEGEQELRVAQDELRRSLRELEDVRYALDQSAIVATTDSAGTITRVNAKFCEISKYSREELLGQNHRLINSGHHPSDYFERMWQTISAGQLWHGEIKNRAKDGTEYWVDTTIVPFLDEHERPYQYVAIRHDITERKRAESGLREQAALTRLGQMAAVVAHELKNPLAGLRGALEVIGRRQAEASPDRQVIGEMVARIDSLNQMVQDLLGFARPTPPRLAPVPVAVIVSETVTLLESDPEWREMRMTVSGDAPVVLADGNLIRAVLLNLLINAGQAMGRTGEIGIEIVEEEGVCQVRVTDSGPGIPEDVREQVFEPFFTTKHRGTGLGLSVARRTIELHGGRLWCYCPEAGGTVMTFSVPLATEARQSA